MDSTTYLCSENNGADELRGYRAADLHLFFAYAKSRFSYDAAHLRNKFNFWSVH